MTTNSSDAATKRRCTTCGGEGNHFFADHDPVYAESAATGRESLCAFSFATSPEVACNTDERSQ